MLPEYSNYFGNCLLNEAVMVWMALEVVVCGYFSAVPWCCALPLSCAAGFPVHSSVVNTHRQPQSKQLIEGKL